MEGSHIGAPTLRALSCLPAAWACRPCTLPGRLPSRRLPCLPCHCPAHRAGLARLCGPRCDPGAGGSCGRHVAAAGGAPRCCWAAHGWQPAAGPPLHGGVPPGCLTRGTRQPRRRHRCSWGWRRRAERRASQPGDAAAVGAVAGAAGVYLGGPAAPGMRRAAVPRSGALLPRGCRGGGAGRWALAASPTPQRACRAHARHGVRAATSGRCRGGSTAAMQGDGLAPASMVAVHACPAMQRWARRRRACQAAADACSVSACAPGGLRPWTLQTRPLGPPPSSLVRYSTASATPPWPGCSPAP